MNKQKIQTYQQLVEEGPKNFLSLEKEKLENKFLAGSVLPTEFDWREKGIISRVKEQSTCGACWTFSTTGIIESQYALKYGKLIEFSE